MLSLREDYFHYLIECNRLSSMKIIGNDILSQKVLYAIGNFSPDETKAIIERLLDRSNNDMEPELIAELVQDLAKELGEVRPIELQVVGTQLETEKITTLAAYKNSGLKAELVTRYLAEVVADCGEENQQAANIVLYLLTDEKGTRPLKTRGELEKDWQILTDKETSNLDLVLKIFVESGLVILLPENPAERYQLVHDYLAALIRQQQEPKLKELRLELEREKEQRKQTEEELKQSEKTKQILAAANQKAKQRIQFGSGVLLVSLTLAVVVGIWAGKSTIEAQQLIAEAQEGTRLERESVNALKQFDFQQIEALLTAMHAGQDLKKLVKDGRPLEKYPTVSPLLALQTILNDIQEKTLLKWHQGEIFSASFSPDGQHIVTTSHDERVQVWDLSGNLLAILDNKATRVWDLLGNLLAEFKGHQGSVNSANFSPRSTA